MPNGAGCWPNQSPDSPSTRRPHAPCTAAVNLLSCVQPDAQMLCETRTCRTQLQCTRYFVYYVANGACKIPWHARFVSIPTSSVDKDRRSKRSDFRTIPLRACHNCCTPQRHRSSFIYPCQVLLTLQIRASSHESSRIGHSVALQFGLEVPSLLLLPSHLYQVPLPLFLKIQYTTPR